MVSKRFLTTTRALLDICKYIIDQGVASRLMAIIPLGKWQRATENGDVLRGLSKPQAQRTRKHGIVLSVSAIGAAALVVAATLPVFARDLDGLYRESPLHDWFEHLASGKGLCCSFADGYAVQDADWDTIGGRYRVRVPIAAQSSDTVWVGVPDDAVITEPNKSGHTMVWPLYDYHGVSIRCFMPGNMT
jgi:hypothetical protein